ncbi:MAG: response regulator transcription factor [Trueperaceae bacterium]
MTILVIEDEAILGQTLKSLLEYEGYQAHWVDSLQGAWECLVTLQPDLIALDIMLPEGENAGFDFAEALRSSGDTTPILFVSARDTVEDRITGLDLGGDDYLVKPYSLGEFTARVRALLRREAQTKQSVLRRGPLELDFRKRNVKWDSKDISLSEREFALLEHFARNPERIYTAEELLDKHFPEADSGKRVIRVYVHYLRQKLGEAVITTASGGYRLGV